MNPPILSLSPRPFPALLGLSALAALALAPGALHAAQDDVTVGIPNEVSFYSSEDPVTLGAVAAGDLDGNGNAELAAVWNGDLMVFPDPAVLDDGVIAVEDVHDVAFCESLGNGMTAFCVTSMRGLEVVTQVDPGEYTVTLVSSDSRWQNAKVRSGVELTGSGSSAFLVGLTNAGTALFQAQWSSGSLGTPQNLSYTFNPAQLPLLDITLLNWDGDSLGVLEVGILHSAGVQVRPRVVGAAQVLNRSGFSPGDSITVLNDAACAHDVLAWITHSSASSQVLLLFSPAFLSPPGITAPYLGPYELPSLFSAATGGDIDGDGDDDLLLTSSASSDATLVENHSDGSWLDPGPVGVVPFVVDEAEPLGLFGGNVHRLITADFFAQRTDSGGSIDSLAVVDSDGAVAKVYPIADTFGETHVEQPSNDDFKRVTFTSSRALNGCEACDEPNEWELELDMGWGATPGVTHVEMIVKRWVNGAVQNLAYHHSIHDLHVGANGPEVRGTLVTFQTYSPAFPSESNDCGEHKSDVYFAMVRPVILNANETQVVQAWRWSILSMTGNCSSYSWMAELYGHSECDLTVGLQVNLCDETTPPCESELYPCNPHGLGSSYIPSAVPQSKIPTVGHVLPVVNPWNY